MSQLKTKDGFTIVSNDYVTWAFYEQAYTSVSYAIGKHSIEALNKGAILICDNHTHECIYSRWPGHVYDFLTLALHMKRDRIETKNSEKF